VQRLLGEIEVAEQAHQGGEDVARVGAVDGVNPRARLFGHDAVVGLWIAIYHVLSTLVPFDRFDHSIVRQMHEQV